MKTVYILIVLIVMVLSPPVHGSSSPGLKGDYLGQAPPGMEPVVFAPGFISTGLAERDAAFTPDGKEFYFTVGLEHFFAIVVTRQGAGADGTWSKPEIAPFSGRYSDIEPCISPDGKRFYFVSKRPLEEGKEPSKFFNIWVMERGDGGWSTPQSLGAPINGEWNVFYPSVTRDGTLYYTRGHKDRSEYIYRSRLTGGKYGEPEKLGDGVNSTKAQFNAFIAPDESYLIVPVFGRKDSVGGTDYYVTFRTKDDKWSGPINLGNKINTPGTEYTPYVTPDGKYFFFNRMRGKLADGAPGKRLSYKELTERSRQWGNGAGDLYWVDAAVIKKLKPKSGEIQPQ